MLQSLSVQDRDLATSRNDELVQKFTHESQALLTAC
jgi:hypothetical protein